MKKLFLFDIDHVLVHPPSYGANHTLEEAGLDVSWTSSFFLAYYDDCQRGNIDLVEVLTPYLKTCGWTKSTKEFLNEWFSYEYHLDEELLTYIQTLREQGFSCVINSDQEKYRKHYILEILNFSNLFDASYCSCDVGYLKQDEKRFEIVYDDIVKQFGRVEKDEIFFVDDQQKNVDVAKKFGIDAVVYKSNEKTIKEIERRIKI